MPLNPYDNCPCGSGKKFKWCCTSYFDKIEQALEMLQQSQFENACRVMEGLAKQYPDKPQIWGYYAHMQFREGHMDKAEELLQKAFEIDPNFPMGLLLRGLFRQSEGEVIGALLLFRKAAEAYPPEARDQLSQVYEMIARNEIILNRVLACRAALGQAVACAPPEDTEIREQFDGLFGKDARMPEIVKKQLMFRPTAKPVTDPPSSRLSDARKLYEGLTNELPGDPAAWFNLGVVCAWLGDHPAAVNALNKSIELEWNDKKAEEAAALVEVIRCGQGMEDDSDYVEHRSFIQIRDANAVMQLLQAWDQEGRMFAAQSDEQGSSFSCMLMEEIPSLVDTGTVMGRVVCNVGISNGMIRLWHRSLEQVTKVAEEIRDRLNMAVGQPQASLGLSQFGELLQEALAYPIKTSEISEAEAKLRSTAEAYFEGVWSQKPLKALAGVPPVDAAGSKLMRKRLFGIIRFLEDVLVSASPRKRVGNQVQPLDVYDFNRLRHKLGLEYQADSGIPAELRAAADALIAAESAASAEKARALAEAQAAQAAQAAKEQQEAAARQAAAVAAAAAAAAATPATPAKKDFSAMSAADLAGLNRDELTVIEIEDAMRAALKIDARELAVAFARSGVGRPAEPAKPDRYPLFACAIQGAIAEGNIDSALQLAIDGGAYDASNNEGKRVNEFAVQRGRLYSRKGDIDAAVKEFNELIARSPDEPKFYITAMETMLSAKQPAHALAFAELGLAKARSSGNRDLEGACMELSEAARRMR